MNICKNCGWAIPKSQWNASICDDCAIDIQTQHNKEQEIRV